MQVRPAQLRLLAQIRSTGSLAGAARELGISAAAVTGQLRAAEHDWKVQLVIRGSRGAQLTPAGSALADLGDRIDAVCVDASQLLDAMLRSAAHRLRIGTFQSAAQHLLPAAVTALRHRHPECNLSISEIRSEMGLGLLASGALDVAVIAHYEPPLSAPSGIRVKELIADPLAVCLPDDHPLVTAHTQTRGLRLEQLRNEDWIVITVGGAARQTFDDAAAAEGFVPRVQFETSSYNVAQALVATGIGVALMDRLTIEPTPGATHRELIAPTLRRVIYAATTSEPALPDLQSEFVELLCQVSADLAQSWTERPIGNLHTGHCLNEFNVPAPARPPAVPPQDVFDPASRRSSSPLIAAG
jgi:molybdate transport repressor ModE-like protein